MTFSDFTTEDFLQHPDFRKWVLEGDAAATAFWADVMQQHPGKIAEIQKAKEMLLLIAEEHTPGEEAEAATWARIEQSIAAGTITKRITMRRWLPYAAAVLAGLLIATYMVWMFRGEKGELSYKTAMGELRTIELPDHSVIRLNVNSSVHYARHWSNNKPREIWLSGEAYFSVTHQHNNQSFIVHTNDVDIKVVGTEFNVNTRRVKTQVVLNKGMVQLTLNGKKDAKPIIMKPGDMVVYSAGTAELMNKKVDPENYSSWQQKELRFNEAGLAEVVRSVQDNMGITVELADSAFGQQTFTGTIPLDNIEVFFKTLQRSFDCQIERKGTNSYRINNN